MLKQLYDYVLRMAAHPKAPYVLFAVSFIESSIFPIPPDVILIPMIIVNFDKAFWYATICTVGSVLGGIAGYAIGALLFDTVGQNIIAFYEIESQFEVLKEWYAEYDVFIVGAAGFSPIPYKIFTIMSGLLAANLPAFIVASILSRGARFFLIAWLLWRGGPAFKGWIENNFYPLTMAATVVIILGFVLLKVVLGGA